MRRLKFLTNRHRTPSTNLLLGLLLAFNAGAVNAGGFLVMHMYASHMTGFASQLSDGVVLGNLNLILNALSALLSFMTGAAICAILVSWGRRHQLQSVYALPLLLEALLMLLFGMIGAATLAWPRPFAVPVTVLLLAFIMGLQNAVVSKTSRGSMRTTHMTGNITDLGIEIGKMLYFNRERHQVVAPIRHHPQRMRVAGGLVSAFILGGIAGAFGFSTIGFFCVLPLATIVLLLALPPLIDDFRRAWQFRNSRR